MGKQRQAQFRISGSARRDIAAILKRSMEEFGLEASRRYQAFIRQALLDIEADPERIGLIARPDLMVEGARTHHISQSRTRAEGPRVKHPRHFLLYRRGQDGVTEIARVLQDDRDLARHLPAGYQRREPGN